MILGFQVSYSQTSCDFFLPFFIRPTDRPTQNQEMHSTLRKKRGMTLNEAMSLCFSGRLPLIMMPDMNCIKNGLVEP